jgi:hypothetical protein
MISLIQNMFFGNYRIKKAHMVSLDFLDTTLNTVLEIVIAFLEYVLGMIIGIVLGWAAGWSVGYVYQDLYEPVYLTTFEAVRFWYYLPQTFGQYGAIIAACVSIPIVYIASVKNLNQSPGEQE